VLWAADPPFVTEVFSTRDQAMAWVRAELAE
jgi:hypothetical protein